MVSDKLFRMGVWEAFRVPVPYLMPSELFFRY